MCLRFVFLTSCCILIIADLKPLSNSSNTETAEYWRIFTVYSPLIAYMSNHLHYILDNVNPILDRRLLLFPSAHIQSQIQAGVPLSFMCGGQPSLGSQCVCYAGFCRPFPCMFPKAFVYVPCY